jgi:hypothetical protein
MPLFKIFLAGLLTAGLMAVSVLAQTPLVEAQPAPNIQAALEKAKLANAAGDNNSALEAIFQAMEAVWNQAPLAIRNAAFVTDQPENFGFYNPKPGDDFSSSEPIIFYCEPIGYTLKKEAGGTYGYSILGAFSILNADTGETLGGQDNLGPYELQGFRTFSTETMLAMTIGIQGLPAGSYTLKVTLTDNFQQSKTAAVTKNFRLVDR